MKTKRTTTGSKSLFRFAAVLLALILIPVHAKGKKQHDAPAEPFATIAGTVFQQSGLSLSSAEVSVVSLPGSDKPEKPRKINALVNHRGEFSVRVPVAPMQYRVEAKGKGYQPQSKDVTIEGEQHKEINFVLEPEK